MKIINFGSLNIDHVYRVPTFVRPGETLSSHGYSVYAGGKGLNQSVALALAGARVLHAGKIGPEGGWLKKYAEKFGVDSSLIVEGKTPTGHAMIQVTTEGENSILLFGGANQDIADGEIQKVMQSAGEGDLLVLQNELNATREIMEAGLARGLCLAFNPAPFTAEIAGLPLDRVNYLIFNEMEGAGLVGSESPNEILSRLGQKFPKTHLVLTLGKEGALYACGSRRLEIPGLPVKAVDTTAAGDTFLGYFLAGISLGHEIETVLNLANKAASICVTRRGACESIPRRQEVDSLFQPHNQPGQKHAQSLS